MEEPPRDDLAPYDTTFSGGNHELKSTSHQRTEDRVDRAASLILEAISERIDTHALFIGTIVMIPSYADFKNIDLNASAFTGVETEDALKVMRLRSTENKIAFWKQRNFVKALKIKLCSRLRI